MNGWLDRRMGGKAGEKVNKQGFSEKVTFQLRSKEEVVMNDLQEQFQKEETARSQGMTRFGMSEEGQWGYRRVKAVLGNGDHHGRVRD